MITMPVKRHQSLVGLSGEHHHGLMLCWKIREGFKRDVKVERIKSYAEWFWQKHLVHHFEAEEKYIFPVLGKNDDLVKKALSEHRRLKRLFQQQTEIPKVLSRLEEELERHIRFEERILFNKVQEMASPEQLVDIENHHKDEKEQSCEKWEDEFWK